MLSTIEKAKDDLLEFLFYKVTDLTMISKIELGDDVIDEIKRLREVGTKDELINLMREQIAELTMLSKIELSDKAITEIRRLQSIIHEN